MLNKVSFYSKLLLSIAVVALTLAPALQAQSDNARISGTVTDNS